MQRRSRVIGAIAVLLCLLFLTPWDFAPPAAVPVPAPSPPIPTTDIPTPESLPPAVDRALSRLSPPRPHPLPTGLLSRYVPAAGDYFDQVQSPIVGALVWSRFPVTVHIQPIAPAEQASPFLQRRSQAWIEAVQAAVAEWQALIPLQLVTTPEGADITLTRSPLPLRLSPPEPGSDDPRSTDRATRRLPIPRARSAETRFELYARPAATTGAPSILAHRMRIAIRPDQAVEYLQAAARHELGHALGIWGHSSQPTDALYFSQVRNPAPISQRDINTLKRVYEQPTRLGWAMQGDRDPPSLP